MSFSSCSSVCPGASALLALSDSPRPASSPEECDDLNDSVSVCSSSPCSPRCSPRLLAHVSKIPFRVLAYRLPASQLPAAKQKANKNTAKFQPPGDSTPPSASASTASSQSNDEDFVMAPIRVMGSLQAGLYFVAADLSALIHSRKSNIAKAVASFADSEKGRMAILCTRSNGTLSTHVLTVLTIAGVRRLLQASRSAVAFPLLRWILEEIQGWRRDFQDEGKIAVKQENKRARGKEEENYQEKKPKLLKAGEPSNIVQNPPVLQASTLSPPSGHDGFSWPRPAFAGPPLSMVSAYPAAPMSFPFQSSPYYFPPLAPYNAAAFMNFFNFPFLAPPMAAGLPQAFQGISKPQ